MVTKTGKVKQTLRKYKKNYNKKLTKLMKRSNRKALPPLLNTVRYTNYKKRQSKKWYKSNK